MKKVSLILLAGLMTVTLASCGSGGANTIKFYAFGDEGRISAYLEMVNTFNETVGAEKGIKVAFSPYPEDSYEGIISSKSEAKSGPDVFAVLEKKFKSWARMDIFEPLDDYITTTGFQTDDIWAESLSRYRYDTVNNTSKEDDPLYSMPIDVSPTALYYNRSVMENSGIIVIGVKQSNLDEWNNNEIPDLYGKYKRDYARLEGVTVPAKGYYRSDNAYRGGDWKTWRAPDVSKTILVFNDQIEMNWDEVEDLGLMFTKKRNPSSPTEYGYYTEWWFNYGWSVGGDCVQDLSGQGDWTFSLPEKSPNYKVIDGKSYVGHLSGKTYAGGEILSFRDKLDIAATDVLTADNQGGFLKNGQIFGNNEPTSVISKQVLADVKSAANPDGVLVEIPSTKTAFARFARLAGEKDKDLNICPYPESFGSNDSFSYFVAGKTAMIVEQAIQIQRAENDTKFNWGCAPLPIYKEYDNDGSVKCEGVSSGHSNSISISIRRNSTKKPEAFEFLKFMCGKEGQAIKSKYGFVPNQKSLVSSSEFIASHPYMSVFLKNMDTQRAGDWWYMENDKWITIWSNPLNNEVRNGLLPLESWFTDSKMIKATNDQLAEYKNKWKN